MGCIPEPCLVGFSALHTACTGHSRVGTLDWGWELPSCPDSSEGKNLPQLGVALPSWHFQGPFLRDGGSPGIPSHSLPSMGKEGGEESRINKRIGYCTNPTACAAQNSNAPSQGKQNSPGVNANSLQLR